MKTSSLQKLAPGLVAGGLAAACGLFDKPSPWNGTGAEPAVASARSALTDTPAEAPAEWARPAGAHGFSEAVPVADFPADKFCIRRKLDRTCIRSTPDDQDADGFPAGVDCDDHDPYAYPGAHEAECNNADEDCDGEDYCPPDLDGDGFSGPSDCDDRDPARHRGAAETNCNGIDEDCDGFDWCDADGDGESDRVDCNDRDATISRHAKEITCDRIDQDCNGSDCCANDGDGDGAPCSADCDDNDPNTYPGAPVAPGCHGKDIDCDGIVDGFCHH